VNLEETPAKKTRLQALMRVCDDTLEAEIRTYLRRDDDARARDRPGGWSSDESDG
jgi:hypothetical protein